MSPVYEAQLRSVKKELKKWLERGESYLTILRSSISYFEGSRVVETLQSRKVNRYPALAKKKK